MLDRTTALIYRLVMEREQRHGGNKMTRRLEILEASLVKKQAKFNSYMEAHWTDVKSANGQPLNDKGAKGLATMRRWEKQNETLLNIDKEIEKTKNAIERERNKIENCNDVLETLPGPILTLLANGTLIQWRKHPHVFFVSGVEKARIFWDENTRKVSHKYVKEIKNKDEYATFRDVFNNLLGELAA